MVAHGGLQCLMEPLLLEVLDNLEAQDLLRSGSASLLMQQVTASPFLWFRTYCNCYRGHLSPPPSFSELAAGAPTELDIDRFAWRRMACCRARLAPSLPVERCLSGDTVCREMAPPERAGMVDVEHNGCSPQSVVWQQPLAPLPLVRPIAYAELYVHGGASVGLVSGPAYRPGYHVGWLKGSLGYHGDDGTLFLGGPWSGAKFGPTFGLDPELVVPNDRTNAPRKADVVGVGIDFGDAGGSEHPRAEGEAGDATRTAFFTKNGALVGSVKVACTMRFLAFALHRRGDRASVNMGTCRFLFDIEAYSQEPQPASTLGKAS
uniref:SPRY domain-containing protein n=1 Tax=Alexandrium monilatum TaxID=311494 RepID=A0A7S4SSI8_9DINO|mmetsp:Transcript_48625/g.152126  ORF Transcript_48625/g.152126 Transcript_48625/m.152126 type:complete len:319 (-) Transcript_48625:115-1071(-)